MPKPSGASDLVAKVRFQRRAEADDAYGNAEGDWYDLPIERSASLLPTRGGDAVQEGRMNGSASWDLWVRHDSGTRSITTADRVVDARDASRTFGIAFGAADMDGERRWLFLQLTSGRADG